MKKGNKYFRLERKFAVTLIISWEDKHGGDMQVL